MKNRFKNIKVQMLVAAGALSSSVAMAAPDSSEVVAEIGGFGTYVAAVGSAMVLITIAKKAWGKVGG